MSAQNVFTTEFARSCLVVLSIILILALHGKKKEKKAALQ